jgi:hypothetical protein
MKSTVIRQEVQRVRCWENSLARVLNVTDGLLIDCRYWSSLCVLAHLCDGVSDAPPFSTASVLCVPDRALSQSSVLITRTRASGVGSAFGFRILRFVQDSEVRVPEVRV